MTNGHELAIVLQEFAGNIEGKVFAVDNALDEIIILWQEVFAVVHDQHAVRVERQAALVIVGVIIERWLAWNVEDGAIGEGSAFGVEMDMAQ